MTSSAPGLGFALNSLTFLEASAPKANAYARELHELLPPEGLTYTVANNYLWTAAALEAMPALRESRTGGLVIAGSADTAYEVAAMLDTPARPWVGGAPNNLEKFGHNHSKFFIGVYPDALRLSIMSLNLVPKDWSRKTQSIWTQAFPLKAGGSFALFNHTAYSSSSSSSSGGGDGGGGSSSSSSGGGGGGGGGGSSSSAGDADYKPSSDFEGCLLEYFYALRRGKVDVYAAVHYIKQYEFGAATAHLVASMPGTHSRRALTLWGHRRIRWLLAQEPRPASTAGRTTAIIAQVSSHSSFSNRWLRKTDGFLGSLTSAQSPSARAPGPRGQQAAPKRAAQAAPATDRIALVWPAADTVRRSYEGWAGGGSLPCSPDVYQGEQASETLPRLRLYDASVSGRGRSMPHIKTLLRIALPRGVSTLDELALRQAQWRAGAPSGVSGGGSGGGGGGGGSAGGGASASASSLAGGGDAGDDVGVDVLWMYTGSHNLSRGAWGWDQDDFNELRIGSYELGVLITPAHYARALSLLDAQGRGPLALAAAASAAAAAASITPRMRAAAAADARMKAAAAAAQAAAAAPLVAAAPPLRVPLAAAVQPDRSQSAATVCIDDARDDEAVIDLVSEDEGAHAGGGSSAGGGGSSSASASSSAPAAPASARRTYVVRLQLAYAPDAPAHAPLAQRGGWTLPLPVPSPQQLAGDGPIEVTVLLPVPYAVPSAAYRISHTPPATFRVGADVPWTSGDAFPGKDAFGHERHAGYKLHFNVHGPADPVADDPGPL